MYYPSLKEFVRLSKKGNLIPVYKEIMADMETPVSAFQKIQSEYSFLLESVEGGEKIARFSFLGSCQPASVVNLDSFDEIKKLLQQFRPVRVAGLPRFHGGLVGYISYDAVSEIEPRLRLKKPDELKLPLMSFFVTDTLLAFDHVKHKIIIISNAQVTGDPQKAYQQACQKISQLEKKLAKTLSAKIRAKDLVKVGQKKLKVSSNLSRQQYENLVRQAKQHIRCGDIIQVVLSQRLQVRCPADTFQVYRALRTINPSPYMYYLKFKGLAVIGSSPEVMVRLEDGLANLRPIAGTRQRGKDEAADEKLVKELLASTKERAEHIMLVDLGRNDLGRVCFPGSVRVTEEMTVEKYSHVFHLVSNVCGQLQKGQGAVDLLKACFPAGTVSGAPKVRAMEIIEELEKTRRGLYAGSVGYFDFSGNLDMAITIRTIIVKNGQAYVQAGAGIVADSQPAREYQETLNKARALIAAVESATC